MLSGHIVLPWLIKDFDEQKTQSAAIA